MIQQTIVSPPNNPFSLAWFPEENIGFFPVDEYWKVNNLTEDSVYNSDYFDKYVGYEEKGKNLNTGRVRWVEQVLCGTGHVLDVGIGSGTFVASNTRYFGYDVNPAGITWLRNKNKYVDMYKPLPKKIIAYTFWDSLEHIKDIDSVLKSSPNYIFVSIPIFENVDAILKSKHYRKDEHFWYFTEKGFVDLLKQYGYGLVDTSNFETEFGRESIKSFAFVKLHRD